MISDDIIILSAIFFLISILYSSAGFGGGSSYIAFLAFFNINFLLMKSIALICNIVVVTGNLVVFQRKGILDLKRTIPLTIVSIPMAFVGGLYNLKADVFYILLGISLLIAGLLLIINTKVNTPNSFNKKPVALLSSMGIGLFSGLAGIGGGIFLSPVLHFIGWSTAKKIAATASFFILINSIAGLIGHFIRITPGKELINVIPLTVAVVIGGQIGSRITAYKLNPPHVKIATAILVLLAGMKILADHL